MLRLSHTLILRYNTRYQKKGNEPAHGGTEKVNSCVSSNAFRSTFSSIALETIDGSSLEFMRMVGDDVENVQLT